MKRSLGLFLALGLTALAVGYYALERGTRIVRSEQAVAAHADEVFRARSTRSPAIRKAMSASSPSSTITAPIAARTCPR
ncbi:hypothetical protein AUC69_13345 [Methyloceanibacter superfactus]|uniref:Uncharacterized protein n=1 Tax=Methyloceanibacter superfactus TaxID=1774969 RepID=A0A1E3VVW0_9HYPH|nr:hypothetical protein AUC69_13345 [Methyloceanibacter superfactus]